MRAWRGTTPSCPAQLPHFLTCASVERDDAQLSCAAATLLFVCKRGEGRRPAVLRSCHTSCASVERDDAQLSCAAATLLNVCERGEGRRPAVLRSCHTSFCGLQREDARLATSSARALQQTFPALLACTGTSWWWIPVSRRLGGREEGRRRRERVGKGRSVSWSTCGGWVISLMAVLMFLRAPFLLFDPTVQTVCISTSCCGGCGEKTPKLVRESARWPCPTGG